MTYTNKNICVQAAAQHFQPRLMRHSAWHLGAMAAFTTLGLGLALGQANAQENEHSSHGSHSAQASAATPSEPTAADRQELSEGEVTRWDARSQKITLRHGELKNLEMPPMSMVFLLQDLSQASQIRVGKKVRFRAEQVNGALIVTRFEVID